MHLTVCALIALWDSSMITIFINHWTKILPNLVSFKLWGSTISGTLWILYLDKLALSFSKAFSLAKMLLNDSLHKETARIKVPDDYSAQMYCSCSLSPLKTSFLDVLFS